MPRYIVPAIRMGSITIYVGYSASIAMDQPGWIDVTNVSDDEIAARYQVKKFVSLDDGESTEVKETVQ